MGDVVSSWVGDGVFTGQSPQNKSRANMMKTTNIGLLVNTAIAALGISIAAVPESKAAAVYVNGHAGGALVRTGPAPRYYAPHTTTVKHNTKKDTVKVCREYYYGTKNCAKWSY